MGTRTTGRTTAVVLAATLIASSAFAQDRLLLVSWDGVRRTAIHELLAVPAGDPCPAKKRPPVIAVAAGGCLPVIFPMTVIDSHTAPGKPLTRPQHASMLSGYDPSTSGVLRNVGRGRLEPGWSIYERLKSARPELGMFHVASRKYVSRGVIKWANKAGYLDVNEKRGGRGRGADRWTAIPNREKFVELFGPFSSQYDEWFAFYHEKIVDTLGHRSGWGNVQYMEAIVALGQRLAEIREILPAGTGIIVTSDHGGVRNHHVNPTDPLVNDTFIATTLDVTVAQSVADVTPSILDFYGISANGLNPPLDGGSFLQ